MNQTENKYQTQWTVEGFMSAFEETLKTEPVFYKAYQLTEDKHHQLFGFRRYTNYESFRKSRANVILKKRK